MVPPRTEIGILGPVEVRADGGVVPVSGDRARVLLAVLAVARGHRASVDRLADALWGDAPPPPGAQRPDRPRNVANALQARISQLRKALVAAGVHDLVLTEPGGYRLAIDDDALDAARAERLVADATAALVAGEAPSAAATLRQALALWRGDALADVVDRVDDPGLAAEARRLDELRLVATERRIEADLAAGRGADLVGELEALVAAEPLRERLWGHLMLALYRAGRQGDALEAYRRLRERLLDELGLEPGEPLRDLEARILAQDPGLDPPAAPSPPTAAVESRAAPTNLRPARTSFVGRGDEVAQVRGHLADHRLVTLIGPGGTGKTRLALQVAAGLIGSEGVRDGVWLVELAAVTSGEDVLPQIAVALGVATAPPPGPAARATLPDRLFAALADRAALVVLDNCEHLLDASAAAAEALVDASADLRVLATSREALRVPGEAVWPVPPLAVPSSPSMEGDRDADVAALGRVDAVRLFVDRAAAANPGFRLDGATAGAVAEICRRLDGLPLALELAAARTAALPVDVLARRLGDRFRLLVGGSRTAVRRQQTLEAVVEWSYDLLDEPQRAVFRRLGTFAGGADLDAVEAVCAAADVPRDEVLPVVAALVDKSLVVATPHAGGARYAMLETLREFALRRLVAEGDPDAARDRHAAWCAALAAEGDRGLRGGDQLDWLERLEREHDNLRGALAWRVDTAAPDADGGALDLAADLAWFWWLRDHRSEARRWLSAAVAAADAAAVPAARAARARAWLAFLLVWDGLDASDAVTTAVAAAAASVDADVATAATAHVLAAYVTMAAGDLARATDLAGEAARLSSETGDAWIEATAVLVRATLTMGAGDVAGALADADAAVARATAAGDRWGELQGRQLLGLVQAARGAYDAAEGHLSRAATLADEIGVRDQSLALHVQEVNLATLRGEPAAARSRLERILADIPADRLHVPAGMAHYGIGLASRRLGDLDRAEGEFRAAVARFDRDHATEPAAEAHAGLAFTAAARGDGAVAEEAVAAAVRCAPVAPATRGLICEAAAAAAHALGDAELAARRLGAAEALREAAGLPLSGGERLEVDRLLEQLRGALGDGLPDVLAAGRATDPTDILPRSHHRGAVSAAWQQAVSARVHRVVVPPTS